MTCARARGHSGLARRIPNIKVTREAGIGREALELIKSESPRLLLMDIAMTELG